MKILSKFLGIFILGFLFFASCSDEPPATISYRSRTYEESVERIIFAGPTATHSFDNLRGNDIFLVKVNQSGIVVNAANTGRVQGQTSAVLNNSMSSYSVDRKAAPMGYAAASEFNANPPPIKMDSIESFALSMPRFIAPAVGNTRMFWVETFLLSSNWEQRQATLIATGRHGNIWVMDSSRSKITTAQAQLLASRFDQIYPIATNILGYEFGGGPNSPFPGGRDGDPKIQILIYDLVDASGDVAAGGFFHGKDFFPQSELDGASLNVKTNLAEIFYVDASQVNWDFDYTISILIHELQHMIHFNEKIVSRQRNSATWYNEMLSLMAEDIIAPMVGVSPTNPSHVMPFRIPEFLQNYHQVGLTEWPAGLPNELFSSYAKLYAFGAYLLRNHGGAELLREIMTNDTVNIESISAALNAISPSPGMTFENALARFGEVMVFSGSEIPEGGFSFNRTDTKSIGAFTYIAYGFDVWKMNRRGGGLGPNVFDLSQRNIRQHSISLHSTPAWRNITGSFTVILERPADDNVIFYLLVR
jgi:hypothetical protein